ncbi:putative carbohydrate-binding module family 1 protein [Botrytis fragariae]|uniref:Putative carbohydrate-binding module family 1 protein n=1 Tax=Botrytis fragariae TaxID=1964551 RepID=A0A8H6EL54_9HELO|nr:putative carbohydrate-binding module family 1 protein [Botrytis fragariae]KAF5876273.1 putative carbohydrate-binding module family 1 protein [Botrytis fragariae]
MYLKSQLQATLLMIAGIQNVYAQQAAWGQCGGTGWTGATTCVSGYVYYSQCLPGTASSSTTIATTPATTTTGTPTTTHSTTTTLSTTTTTGVASYPGATLQSGYYWIRAVETPNFHSYLQASPTAKPGTALLADRSTAGQYQIVSGQLVELIAPNTFLYANVQPPANSSAVRLSMTFNTTQNTFGTFAFSGDAVTWSVASISRPNLSAWLVCGAQELWINLGNYAYLTPTGCVDETIHYFNGATVD